jgi:hypothetical protein
MQGGGMNNYCAIVHYHLKKGMENQAIKFFEKELIKKATEYGCHSIELLISEKDPSNLIGIAFWDSLEDARRFQSIWESKENELIGLCTSSPKREFLKVRATYTEKGRKVA